MREGKRLVINEITNASSDVLALLHPILEDFSTAMLTLPNGETIVPHEGFHVVATDNRPPDLLPEALKDRFEASIEVKDTNPAAFEVLSPDLRKIAATKIGDDRRISARGWISLDRLREEFGLGDACRLVWGLERGRMIHDALVLAMDASKATEADKPKKKKAVRRAIDMEQAAPDCESVKDQFEASIVGTREWQRGSDDPAPSDWSPGGCCACPPCKAYDLYLLNEGIRSETVEVEGDA
jgi:hypothetical protein